jgi:hypothetical protein
MLFRSHLWILRAARSIISGHVFLPLRVSNESGRSELYVQPFEVASEGNQPKALRIQISRDGGAFPRWNRNGKGLFYATRDGKLMAVDVNRGDGGLRFDTPRPLFSLLPTSATV